MSSDDDDEVETPGEWWNSFNDVANTYEAEGKETKRLLKQKNRLRRYICMLDVAGFINGFLFAIHLFVDPNANDTGGAGIAIAVITLFMCVGLLVAGARLYLLKLSIWLRMANIILAIVYCALPAIASVWTYVTMPMMMVMMLVSIRLIQQYELVLGKANVHEQFINEKENERKQLLNIRNERGG